VDARRSAHDQNRERDRGEQLDRGEIERVDGDRFQIRVEVRAVQGVETLGFAPLLSEKLDDPHSSETLLQERVDSREPHADVAVRVANAPSEKARHDYHERNHGERGERETPIHDQHRHADRRQRE